MNGEKTEKATPKRRREAREKGQVVKSIDLNAAVILLLSYLGLKLFGSYIYSDFKAVFSDFITRSTQYENLIGSSQAIYLTALKHFLTICGPIFLVTFAAGLLINYVQVGFLFLPNQLLMKFDKINPIVGFRRIFSLRSAVETIKSLLKMAAVCSVVYAEFKKNFYQYPQMVALDVNQSAGMLFSFLGDVMWKSGLTLLIIGILDYCYQWWEHEKSLMMSIQEIKEEYRLTEGDPQIKARIREIQRQIGMRRMMQQIPKADVVITNPTHYAVALKYDEKTDRAPVVIAKGLDLVALRIKEEAKRHNIHIVENKPLAQALYRTTDIDQEIPEELFRAVAEILAFVYRAKNKF